MAQLFRKDEEKKSLWQKIRDVALTDVGVLARGLDRPRLDDLEEILLASDFGVAATLRVLDAVEDLNRRGKIRDEGEFRDAVEREIVDIMESGNAERDLRRAESDDPTVYLMIGVNGVGKTTTIGKLAHHLQQDGQRVLLAAGDTFRAGAIDQLRIWAERTGAEFVGARPGGDPAAVAFDAIDAARSRGSDTVIVDTAGRLHTQGDLMAELSKVQRVVGRQAEGAPHETLMVLDATVGQNALIQVRTFNQHLPLSGLVLAKLDSTARGGVVVALKEEFDIPVKLVGTGEGVGDLEPFDPEWFAGEILSS